MCGDLQFLAHTYGRFFVQVVGLGKFFWGYVVSAGDGCNGISSSDDILSVLYLTAVKEPVRHYI